MRLFRFKIVYYEDPKHITERGFVWAEKYIEAVQKVAKFYVGSDDSDIIEFNIWEIDSTFTEGILLDTDINTIFEVEKE